MAGKGRRDARGRGKCVGGLSGEHDGAGESVADESGGAGRHDGRYPSQDRKSSASGLFFVRIRTVVVSVLAGPGDAACG